MGAAITVEQVEQALRSVIDPEIGKDIVSLGMVRDIELSDGEISFTLVLTTAACPLRGHMQDAARKALLAMPGVKVANVKLAANAPGHLHHRAGTNDDEAPKDHPNAGHALPIPTAIPGVRHVIAVVSGKGGVGKSTVSANLAVALGKRGNKVGLLDADITGPNIPLMMGIWDTPVSKNGAMVPPVAHGVKVMSVGFFVKDDTPVIWRGSLVSRAVQQFLHEVDWGELDFLVVDMPPGTGDVPLTLIRSIPVSGAVIVTTPQDVALLDARKSLAMFRKMDVPILGIVENMSYYVCRCCGERAEIFGNGGGERTSRELDIEFLGRIPLDERIRVNGDAGTPVALDESSERAKVFLDIADKIARSVGRFCDACHR